MEILRPKMENQWVFFPSRETGGHYILYSITQTMYHFWGKSIKITMYSIYLRCFDPPQNRFPPGNEEIYPTIGGEVRKIIDSNRPYRWGYVRDRWKVDHAGNIWVFPKIGGTRKWMVKIMEHPIKMG